MFIPILGINYLGLKLLEQNKNKILCTLLVLSSIFGLCFYKYSLLQTFVLSFFPQASFFLQPMVFIGISFFTFKLISLAVDTYQGKTKGLLDPFHFVNYLLFFPCYLSGPLDRYDRFVSDAKESRPLSSEEIYSPVTRIIFGLFKKVIVADSLYGLSIYNINNADLLNAPAWTFFLGAYIYTLVLYIDFSGYSDIAIGISKLFGIKTPENFNYPLTARNIQEFWNRWHITFIHWLRDYIYFPLQMFFLRLGVKYFVSVAAFSYIVTFLLAGIWHGDKQIYAIYGLTHGLALAAFQFYNAMLPKLIGQENLEKYNNSKVIRVIATLVTYHFFVFSLIVFLGKFEVLVGFWERL